MLKLVAGTDIDDNPAVEPQLKTGGKGPPGYDWLSKMEVGTEFLARLQMSPNPWLVSEFCTGGLNEASGCVLLIPNRAYNNPKEWFWADPKEFCRSFDLKGIIETPDE